MKTGEGHEESLWLLFDGRRAELEIYKAVEALIDGIFPETEVRVQKTQISFYGRHMFAAVSLPRKKLKAGEAPFVILSLGLDRRPDSARVWQASEPYPGRWTNHIPVSHAGELDEELRGWIEEAFVFSESKRRCLRL